MDSQSQFAKFYENIKLTSLQREDAKKKYNGVCKKLHDHYYPNIEYCGKTKLLIGSYGKKTSIRPPRDVDVIFIMPQEKYGQYADNRSNAQSQLLQDIRNILSEKYTTTDKICSWGKVVLVQFADGTHNVELLPAWENEEGIFLIPNSENGGSWEYWNPRAEIKKIYDSDANTGMTKMIIRMTKKWSEQCSVKIKSFEIENAAVDFFLSNAPQESTSTDVRNFFQYLYNREGNEEQKSHLKTAFERAQKACNYEKEAEFEKATAEWKKVFGDDFPSWQGKAVNNDQSNMVVNSQPIINPPKPWSLY